MKDSLVMMSFPKLLDYYYDSFIQLLPLIRKYFVKHDKEMFYWHYSIAKMLNEIKYEK